MPPRTAKPRTAKPRTATPRPATPRPATALDADAAYVALARRFVADPRITLPTPGRTAFGSNGLRVDGRVFAMCVGGALVVKLPAGEIDAAIALARGARLVMGRRVMKEWLVVHEPPRRWFALATRARAFVADER